MSEKSPTISDKTTLYLSHRGMIEDLRTAFDQDARNLYDRVFSRIRSQFGAEWDQGGTPGQAWHWFIKKNWYFEKGFFYFQFTFYREDLIIGDRFKYMLGISPPKKSRELAPSLKERYPAILEICTRNNITPYLNLGSANGIFIAHKEYLLEHDDLASIDAPFMQAIDEFSPFEPIIDQAVEELKQQGKA